MAAALVAFVSFIGYLCENLITFAITGVNDKLSLTKIKTLTGKF